MKRRNLWFAWISGALLCTLAFVYLAKTTYFRYENSDDILFVKAFMGFEGSPSAFTLYTHTLLAWMLHALSNASPGVAWFSLFQLGVLFVSAVVIVKSVMQIALQNKRPWLLGFVMSMGFLSLLMLFGFCRLSYTTTAAASGAAAVAQLMTLRFDQRKPLSWCLCLLLMVAAYSLRQMVMLAVFPFVLLVLLWRFLQSKDNRPLLGRFVLVGSILFVLLIGIREVELLDPAKREMISFHQKRIELFDYTSFESNINPALEADTELSQTDLSLLQSWYFMDSKVDAQVLETLVTAYEKEPTLGAMAQLETFFKTNPRYLLVLVALVLLMLVCILKDPKTWHALVAFCAVGGGGILLLYLGIQGRVLFRAVDTVVLPCGALLACLAVMGKSEKRPKGWGCKIVLITLCILLGAVVCMHAFATHKVLSTSMDTTSMQREAELESYALLHPETLIVRSPNLLRDTRLLPDTSAGIPQNLILWGDWYCKTPTWYAQFERVGLSGKTFVQTDWLKSALMLATADEQVPNALIASIEDQAGTAVEAVLVEQSGTLSFWKFEEKKNH